MNEQKSLKLKIKSENVLRILRSFLFEWVYSKRRQIMWRNWEESKK